MLPRLVGCLRDGIHELLTGPAKPPIWVVAPNRPNTRIEVVGSMLFFYVALLAPLYFTGVKDVINRVQAYNLWRGNGRDSE